MNARYASVVFYLFALLLPSLEYSPAYSMENRTINKTTRNDQSLERSASQLDAENLRTAQRAALEGLKIMASQLVKTDDSIDEKHAEELGLETKDLFILTSIEEDQLINALPVFYVSLTDLRDFTPTQTAKSLLADTHQLLFPIKIKDKNKFSVTVRSVLHKGDRLEHQTPGKNWRPTRWGQPNLTSRLTTEQKSVKDKIPGSKDFSLVSVPSLNRNFLGYEDNADIKLVPLISDRLFEAGKPLSALDVFLRLVPEAKSVDDSPR